MNPSLIGILLYYPHYHKCPFYTVAPGQDLLLNDNPLVVAGDPVLVFVLPLTITLLLGWAGLAGLGWAGVRVNVTITSVGDGEGPGTVAAPGQS